MPGAVRGGTWRAHVGPPSAACDQVRPAGDPRRVGGDVPRAVSPRMASRAVPGTIPPPDGAPTSGMAQKNLRCGPAAVAAVVGGCGAAATVRDTVADARRGSVRTT